VVVVARVVVTTARVEVVVLIGSDVEVVGPAADEEQAASRTRRADQRRMGRRYDRGATS
jgi:hypothetical protein